MTLKRTCGAWLFGYLLCAAILGAIGAWRFPQPVVALAMGAFGGFILWLGIWNLGAIAGRFGQVRLILRGLGGSPPADGERIAAIGSIQPEGETLLSPFSHSECLIYRYDIERPSGDSFASDYKGLWLTPSVIQTAWGGLHLLAYPELKAKNHLCKGEEALKNAVDYISRTEFQVVPQFLGRDPILDLRKKLPENGRIRYDRRFDPVEPDLRPAYLYEQIVRPGDRVCAIGRYSDEKRAVIPNFDALVYPLTLETGTSGAFLRRRVNGVLACAIGAFIFLGAIVAALAIFLACVPLAAAEQGKPWRPVLWPEVRLERFLREHVRPHLERLGMFDRNVGYPTLFGEGRASGRITTENEDVHLRQASAERRGEKIAVTLWDDDSPRTVLIIDSKDRLESLQLLGKEIPPSTFTYVELDASSSAWRIEGRLTYLTSDPHAPRAHFTFAAALR